MLEHPGEVSVIRETRAHREEAAALLRALHEAQRASERRFAGLRLEVLGGERSRSLEEAIASTRRLVGSYDTVLESLHRDLTDEDLALLEQIGAGDFAADEGGAA